MTLRTSPWPAGTPCWVDVTARDVRAASAFYAAVLGWDVSAPGEGSDEEYGGYVIASARGAAAAGIGPRTQPDSPSAWTLYLATDDVEATAAAVPEHGGVVLLPPGDVGPLGRMAVAADPAGAVFALWEAGTHLGCGVVDEPGGLVWEDLRSPAPDIARAFYAGLFGYSTEGVDMAPEDYTTFALPAGAPLGGIGGMMGEDSPPHWLVYFGVPDADAAAAAAERSGGRVLSPAVDTPFGRMVVLADPDGAAFTAMTLPDEPVEG
ncbi:VOC family protein [uncultured Pseudokineococcus sp.]|uniref:VOC family protein n=1 Tax=uncultured Pseudokineococcus sp. TaxID=1642928 RepID=UPI002612A751|nr:VOC family protein [uncultured Pseudokineococcus sp.]